MNVIRMNSPLIEGKPSMVIQKALNDLQGKEDVCQRIACAVRMPHFFDNERLTHTYDEYILTD
jgi:hypothetical protein